MCYVAVGWLSGSRYVEFLLETPAARFVEMICPVQVGELAQCHWCEKFIVKSDADMLCVDCGMIFSDRLLPVNFWHEPDVETVVVNNDYEDSEYNAVGAVVSDGDSTRDSDSVKEAGTGGTDDWETERARTICIMYEKIADVWHLDRRALPLEDDTWACLIHARALSRCWVDWDGDLVKFGFPEIRFLSRYFAWDAPLGTFPVATG